MYRLLLLLIPFCYGNSFANDPEDRKRENLSPFDKKILKDTLLKEVSGAAYINSSIWVINDGGNSNDLYRIDSNGNILQTVKVSNATNVDWEELTCSKTHLYIGDFGNNFNNRKNLRIYKIALEKFDSNATEVTAEVISFSYPDQKYFTKAPDRGDFDCEAMLYYDNKLHLFTKKRISNGSDHYIVGIEEGYYVADKKETIECDFLPTTACIINNEGYLCGYDLNSLTVNILHLTFLSEGTCLAKQSLKAGSLSDLGQVESMIVKENSVLLISESTDLGFLFFPAKMTSLPWN